MVGASFHVLILHWCFISDFLVGALCFRFCIGALFLIFWLVLYVFDFVAPAFVEAGEAEADAALFKRMDLADKTPDSFSYIRGSECTKIEGTKSNTKNQSEIRNIEPMHESEIKN